MASGNLVVVDEDFQGSLVQCYKAFGRDVENEIADYVTKLRKGREVAILGGAAAATLDSYIGYAEQLKGKAQAITDDLVALAKGYVADVDEADDFLF